MLIVTDINTRTTFILEIWRRGSHVLHASSMPAVGRTADQRVELRRVPLYIRRAAKTALCGGR